MPDHPNPPPGGDDRLLARLAWRCRRGMLENDLIIERFFGQLQETQETLTTRQADALSALMELPDNDLLDLLLARTEPQGGLDRPAVHELLALMRRRPTPD